MSVFASVIYGLISGVTEFLPVSSRGHQAILRYLFGAETRIPLQELLVHIGVLFSVIVSCSEILHKLLREQRIHSVHQHRKMRSGENKSYFDLRLLKTATIPLFIGLFIYFATAKFEGNLLIVMAFWLINAVILFIADHMPRGNRESNTMSALDGIAMGLVGVLSVLPGISRTGTISSYAIARGADDKNTANWCVLLGIPALIFAVLFDLVSFTAYGIGVHTITTAFGCFLSGVAAFIGGYCGISLFKLILNHSGLSKFAYYSIGAALFSFAIYLIT